jgi:hypothetical protein
MEGPKPMKRPVDSARHDLKVGPTLIDPFLRKFNTGFIRFVRRGKGVIDSKYFEHAFIMFPVRNKDVWTPTLGIVNSINGDFNAMVFLLHRSQLFALIPIIIFPVIECLADFAKEL